MGLRGTCFLILAWAAQGLRDENAVHESTTEVVEALGDFRCPAACHQCCQDPVMLGMSSSSTAFKCLIARGGEIPQSEGALQCVNHGQRKYNAGQDKLVCPFDEGQQKQRSALAPCFNFFSCCCHNQERWTEILCKKSRLDEFIMMSNFSEEEERYALTPKQTRKNKKGPCESKRNAIELRVEYQTRPRSEFTKEGCCLAFGEEVTDGRTWYPCVEWEIVPICLLKGERRYQRVKAAQGRCVGRNRQDGEKCPLGWGESSNFGGELYPTTCTCDNGCGEP